MTFFKKFLLYFFIIIGSVIAIAAVILAVMYFAPGTQVLNYVYMNYNSTYQVEFTDKTEIKPTDFEAIEVNSKTTSVYFRPSKKDDVVSYSHRQGMAGFVRCETGSLYVEATIKYKSFSEEAGGVTYKTLVLNIIEPEGPLLTTSDPILEVFVPSYYIKPVSQPSEDVNTADGTEGENPPEGEGEGEGTEEEEVVVDTSIPNLKVLSANTEKGKIGFSTKNGDYISNVTKFYANSTSGGDVQISNPKDTTNYYINTTSGNVNFINPEVVSANVKWTTDNGKMTFVNAKQTPTLTGNLEIYSFIENKGPTVDFGNINGDVKITASYINFKATQIGTKVTQTSLAVTVDKSDMNLGNVYARFTLASKSSKNQNNVKAERLYYNATADDHILDVGAGNVDIKDSIGDVGVDATTGNVKFSNAFDNIKIVTTSGNIDVTYNDSSELDEVARIIEGDLTIDTETGDVVVNNLRGALNVKVSSVKAEGKMEINFLDIKKDSLIKAGSRNVSIGITYVATIEGGGTGRLLLVNGVAEFGMTAAANSLIVSGEDDYISEPKYNTQYRVGYAKDASDSVYTQGLYDAIYGKVVVDTTGKTFVNAKLN